MRKCMLVSGRYRDPRLTGHLYGSAGKVVSAYELLQWPTSFYVLGIEEEY